MSVHSCIYEGTVLHRRRTPIDRSFRYRLFMMSVDLDELPQLFNGRWLWSSNRPNVAWFRRSDYMGSAHVSLSDSVRAFVADEVGRQITGPIRLLTNFRYLGYVFNPLSMYYCFDKNQRLEFIVAEVSNTPWGERHRYLLRCSFDSDSPFVECCAAKELHVSPFLHMNYEYLFRLNAPGRTLSVHVSNWPHASSTSTPDFSADLSLQRRELSGSNLSRALVAYPFMTQRIIAAIYWQAFRLWWRGVPFVPHPNAAEQRASSSTHRSATDHIIT